jgi:hypothetical protein
MGSVEGVQARRRENSRCMRDPLCRAGGHGGSAEARRVSHLDSPRSPAPPRRRPRKGMQLLPEAALCSKSTQPKMEGNRRSIRSGARSPCRIPLVVFSTAALSPNADVDSASDVFRDAPKVDLFFAATSAETTGTINLRAACRCVAPYQRRTWLPTTGVLTGFANPKNTTKPLPPQRVETVSSGVFVRQTSSIRSILLAAHTFPAGSTATPVRYCIPFPT